MGGKLEDCLRRAGEGRGLSNSPYSLPFRLPSPYIYIYDVYDDDDDDDDDIYMIYVYCIPILEVQEIFALGLRRHPFSMSFQDERVQGCFRRDSDASSGQGLPFRVLLVR